MFTSSATLAAGATFVFCHSGLTDQSACDSVESTRLNHNGDDGYLLRCDGAVVDSFGQLAGSAPSGGEWTGGGLGTANRTLRRQCPGTPDTDIGDPFDPSTDWVGFPVDTYDGLGGRNCPFMP